MKLIFLQLCIVIRNDSTTVTIETPNLNQTRVLERNLRSVKENTSNVIDILSS